MKVLSMISEYRKTILLTALAVLSAVSILSVGSTYAYLKDEATTPDVAVFSAAASVDPTVNSDNSVSVNGTNYSVYVRAAVTVVWKNSEGIHATSPEYTLDPGENWQLQSDGFYLYMLPVKSGLSTTPVMRGYTVTSTAPASDDPSDPFTVSVEVVAQTIQAEGVNNSGTPAITEAWGYAKP